MAMIDMDRSDSVVERLSEFGVARYRFLLRLSEPALLDCYLGNVIHGLLKTSLYNVSCVRIRKGGRQEERRPCNVCPAPNEARDTEWERPRNDDCASCERNLEGVCAFGYCLETTAFTGRPDGSANHPHPYVLEPPPARRPNCARRLPAATRGASAKKRQRIWGEGLYKYEAGETIPFNLVLIGRGIDFVDEFAEALREGGEKCGIGIHPENKRAGRPKYMLETKGVSGASAPFSSKAGSRSGEIIRFEDLAMEATADLPRRLELRFMTPTHIQTGGGHYTNRLDFEIFMARLLERIRDLSANHCGQDFDYEFLLSGMGAVKTTYREFEEHVWSRASSRHGIMTHWGITGRLVFEGDLAPFVPFIRLGEYVHVGNMTSFGWGQYEVCAVD